MTSINGLKESLINAGRILASEDQGDFIFGHVTARLPENDSHFLMKPHNFGLEEITPENLITVNLEGEKVAGESRIHIEVFIHSEILRVRPDIGALVHTHAPYAVAFSSLDRPLQGIGHEGSYFHAGIPVFSETADLIIDQTRGKAVARAIADSDVLIMRNHGIVTAGRTIEEATVLALYLERACKAQLMVEACGGATHVCSHEDAVAKTEKVLSQSPRVFDYLTRRVTSETT